MFFVVLGVVATLSPRSAPLPGHGEPLPATPLQATVKVELVTINKENVYLGLRQRIQFARATGVPDAAVAEKINQRLRQAAEEPLDSIEADFSEQGPFGTGESTPRTTMMRSYATVGLVNSRVIAVQHTYSTNGVEFGTVLARLSRTVVIDVATGRELTTRELLSPRVATAAGASDLTALLARSGPGGRLCETSPPGVREFTPADIFGGKDQKTGIVSVFPTPKGVTFTMGLWKLDYPMSCSGTSITVGYRELNGYLGRPLRP
jgi:hypothetical protein